MRTVVLLLAFVATLCLSQEQYTPFCISPDLDIANSLPGPELIKNGNFDEYGTYPWFSGDAEGFAIRPFVPAACGRDQMAAAIDTHPSRGSCVRPSAGLYQKVSLNQTTPKRVFVSAWGSAANADGPGGHRYSLYVDVWYKDGTTLYGLFTPFPLTPGFHRVNVTVEAPKAIDYIFVNLLFREHTGTAFFDQVSVKEEVLLQYPVGQNILADPSFEECSRDKSPWKQTGGATCQLQTCGNARVRTGAGSLALGPQTTGWCFVIVEQVVRFNPPINTGQSLTFSVYTSVNYTSPRNADSVSVTITDNIYNVNITNVPIKATNGFQKFEVLWTATNPTTALQVYVVLQGAVGGIIFDDASLVLNA